MIRVLAEKLLNQNFNQRREVVMGAHFVALALSLTAE